MKGNDCGYVIKAKSEENETKLGVKSLSEFCYFSQI
jgi:hypothetical protein